MKRTIIGIMVFSIFILGCDEDTIGNGTGTPSGSNKSDDWLIPRSDVFDGGPGKDGIPALTDPKFISVEEQDYLDGSDLVLGFISGNEIKAYPHRILDWHEIINDRVGETDISVTYCPLTGTGIGWDRRINGKVTTFGVSGLLYNSNLIPYDRETDSNWSQIRLDCVNGSLIRTRIKTHTLLETTWSTWKKMFPETVVVSTETGHNRNYGRYPYGSYRTDHNYIIFPVDNENTILDRKVRVHTIISNGTATAFPLSVFGEKVSVIEESFEGKDYVVVGNEADNFAVSFVNDPGDGSKISFSAVQDQYPIVMTDEEGNRWNVFGTAVSGPRAGSQLKSAESFIGYWFSIVAFYPDVVLYSEE